MSHQTPKVRVAVQVHKPSQEGEWYMEHTNCTEVLTQAKPAIAGALREARHDRIVHVQQAAAKVTSSTPVMHLTDSGPASSKQCLKFADSPE